MPACAFLTLDDLSGYVADDELVLPPLIARGWEARFVSWRAPGIDWSRFDVVVIRSPWDYQHQLPRFLATLEHISRLTRLENALPIVRWNVRKTYLRDLDRRGIAIVPTIWAEEGVREDLAVMAAALRADELIVKPHVGANAEDVFRVDPRMPAAARAEVQAAYARRPCMVQRFVREVLDAGEVSVVFVGGRYSHAVRKVPRAGDFRVQEEHGGQITPVTPAASVRHAAWRACSAVPGSPLYARVDLVLDGGLPRVMEVEVVEPSLYLRCDPDAPERLAAAIDALRTPSW